MCYYFGKTKSVSEARVRLEERNKMAAGRQELRTIASEDDEHEAAEFETMLNFLKNCNRKQ